MLEISHFCSKLYAFIKIEGSFHEVSGMTREACFTCMGSPRNGKDKMARKSKASSPIRPAPCVDFTKIKPHFQSFQQNDTQGTIDG